MLQYSGPSDYINSMKTPSIRAEKSLAVAALLMLTATVGRADYNPFRTDTYGDALRAGRMEFYMLGQYWDADASTLTGVTLDVGVPPNQVTETGDLTMSFEEAFMWGFGVGYHLNSHFTLRGEFTFAEPEYTIEFNNLSGRAEAFVQAGKFNVDYNIIRGPVTPFISAGIGYVFIDSGIPSGPSEYWCWWDYWWGYVCEGYTPTRTEWWFTGNASAGLRWDINDTVFLRASGGMSWMAADAEWVSAVEAMFAVGWKF